MKLIRVFLFYPSSYYDSFSLSDVIADTNILKQFFDIYTDNDTFLMKM
jgi:hypothetical protein